MKISSKLEELIWEGCAEYKTWTIGTPAAGLEVQENEVIIITGFDYFPFVDPEEDVIDDFGNFIRRIVKQITFADVDKRFNYMARTNLCLAFDGTSFIILPSGSGHTFDTYMIFEKNISCNIVNVPPPDDWAGLIFGDAPDESRQPKTPLGFGTFSTPSIATLQRAQITPSSEFRAFKQTPPTLFGGPGIYI